MTNRKRLRSVGAKVFNLASCLCAAWICWFRDRTTQCQVTRTPRPRRLARACESVTDPLCSAETVGATLCASSKSTTFPLSRTPASTRAHDHLPRSIYLRRARAHPSIRALVCARERSTASQRAVRASAACVNPRHRCLARGEKSINQPRPSAQPCEFRSTGTPRDVFPSRQAPQCRAPRPETRAREAR